MPELPEVETIRRDLQDRLCGFKILDVEIFDKRVIKGQTPLQFKKSLVGFKVEEVARRSKAILIHLSQNRFLVVQVGMTGHFFYGDHLRKLTSSSETKVIFALSNGKYLNYNDHRLFGKLTFTQDLGSIPYLATVGPEPLGDAFSPKYLSDNLKKRKSPIKPLLMNQMFVAGIGNIYASEILFQAKIDPRRSSNSVSAKEIKALYAKTVSILDQAIKLRGTSMRNYRDSSGEKGEFLSLIKVYGKEGERCVKCKQPVKKIVQAGRSTFFCEKCQK